MRRAPAGGGGAPTQQPLRVSGLSQHPEFCFSVFLMNCKENSKTFVKSTECTRNDCAKG